MKFQSIESMQPVVNVINEAAEALNDPHRTISESTIPEVLAGALGAGLGGVGSFAAMYGLGTVVGLSAAGITSGLAAAGAAGYAVYKRGRKANDRLSEGWNKEKLKEYQNKND
jgi:hypothetical protein